MAGHGVDYCLQAVQEPPIFVQQSRIKPYTLRSAYSARSTEA